MNQEGFKFWVVWNPNGMNPRFRHADKDAAIIEAERLAKQNFPSHFFVLEAIAVKVSGERPVITTELNQIAPKQGELSEIPF